MTPALRAPLATLALGSLWGVWLAAQAGGAATIDVASATRHHTVARIEDGRVVALAPCIPVDTADDASLDHVVATGLTTRALRVIAPGSSEWNRVAPGILRLAERREREQRLTVTSSTAPRALDWLFAMDDPSSLYYFEVSRRIPGQPAPFDTDEDVPGTVRVAVSGFGRPGREGQLVPLGTKGELRWEEDRLPRVSRPDLRPLGILSPGASPVWVFEGRLPTGSTVSFFEVGTERTTLAASTRLGRC